MEKVFKVKVNSEFSFDLSSEILQTLDIIKTTDAYHILHKNGSFRAVVAESDYLKKKYTVKVYNTLYTVEIGDSLDQLIEKMGFASGASKRVDLVKAPMPGLLLDIHINEGDEVKEDDPLLILEAMKMENVILSPRSGIVKKIAAKKGAAIDKGQLLVEFEQ